MARTILFSAFLVAALLSASVFAVERELSAHVTSPTSIDTANCDYTGGSAKTIANVVIENSLAQYISINYAYFDNATNAWVNAGKLCNVPTNDMVTCQATIEFRMGGSGAGTYTASLLRLTGTSDAAPGDTFVKEFSFPVRHYTGDRENSLLEQASRVNATIASIGTSCAASPGCCDSSVSGRSSNASATLAEADVALVHCDFATAYAKLVAAETLANAASATLSTCIATTTPTPVRYTPTPLPTQWPQGTPNVPETPTPAPAQTPTPKPQGSSCPVGAGLALIALGCAFRFNK